MTSINWISRAESATFSVLNIIDGQRSPAKQGQVLVKNSNRTGDFIYEFGGGDQRDVEAAIAAARRAFNCGCWRDKSVHERKVILNKLADLIETNSEELALYECIDVGKPIANAQGDIALAASIIRDTAHAGDKLAGASIFDGGVHSFQLHKPLGVVGAIVGWNFPLVLAAHKVGAALITGNSLVLKPSEFTPLSAWRMAELGLEAGIPDGVFNVINGTGAIIGDAIALHDEVDMVAFTGSSATGKRLMNSAGMSNMKRLQLECGGKSPYLVFDDYDGDLEVLAADIVQTAFPNQGAVCSSSTRLLIQSKIYDEILPLIIKQTEAINPADPLLLDTTFGAIINEDHLQKVLGFHEIAVSEGATPLVPGGRVLEGTGGYYLKPALYTNVRSTSPVAREEIFGPLATIFSFESEDEAIVLANDTNFGLAAYAATSDAGRVSRLARRLNAGSIIILSSLFSTPGGVSFGVEPHKQSGLGFEGGLDGLKGYTVTSSVMAMFEG